MRLFADVASRVDDPYLSRAIELAERGRGSTWPNPCVGCVIVADGRIVGEGFHPRAGEPHAEVFALAAAGERTAGASAYVTLEPCAHHGKTPPCADALIAAGIARVVIGMADPNAEAAGGAKRLREAGIEVEFADDPAPFEALNDGWLHRIATGRPLVTVKLGLSLDARVAFEAGARAAITGPGGAGVTRALRERTDAVLVGGATVAADDPELTVRDAAGRRARRQPLRIVLAGSEPLSADARVLSDGFARTLLLAPDSTDPGGFSPSDDVTVERYDVTGGIAGVIGLLGGRGIGELLVEPGPRLMTALWEADLVDVLVTVTAGGMAGAGALASYAGDADRSGDELVRRMRPERAVVAQDVVTTVWRRRPDVDDAGLEKKESSCSQD